VVIPMLALLGAWVATRGGETLTRRA